VSADAGLTMRPVRAGVIDVGSNTVRLLVAGPRRRGLDTILSERTHVGLATDVEREGRISAERLDRVQKLAASYAALARDCGVDRLEVLVTAPGRQSANADELHAALAEATTTPVRQLSAEEEGRLAYAGAVGASRAVPETVAVVDVGGGSSQLMVGTEEGPAWLRTLDIGSLRLTERFIRSDPPTTDELEAVAVEVERAFASLTPPLPLSALATGGTARALRRIAGRRLGEKSLSAVIESLAASAADDVAAEHALPRARARVLPAGTIVLREAHRLLGVKLEVARGGMREGAVQGLLTELAAEAAA
jgi:exopolyphosphatase / guanosine-5'-triphosphate,3'-diphosphate pyrophosphatase